MLLEHADPPWRVALDDELLVVDVRVGVRPVFAQYGVDNSQQLYARWQGWPACSRCGRPASGDSRRTASSWSARRRGRTRPALRFPGVHDRSGVCRRWCCCLEPRRPRRRPRNPTTRVRRDGATCGKRPGPARSRRRWRRRCRNRCLESFTATAGGVGDRTGWSECVCPRPSARCRRGRQPPSASAA